MTYEWSVNQTASPSAAELQQALNALESKGYEIYSVFAISHSDHPAPGEGDRTMSAPSLAPMPFR